MPLRVVEGFLNSDVAEPAMPWTRIFPAGAAFHARDLPRLLRFLIERSGVEVGMPVQRDHAVIVGGGIAGLTAARVLSEHFAAVTILDRDALPTTVEERRNVPQAPHLHGLLFGGASALDELYGGFTVAMTDQGAPPYDPQRDVAYFFPEGWIRRAPSDMRSVFGTRALTEHTIRTLTRRLPNVRFRHAETIGLRRAGGDRVDAVVCDDLDGLGGLIEAELVVDAGGRASRSPHWLADAGFDAPPESTVQPFLGYATVHCHLPEDALPGDLRAVCAPPAPHNTRGAFLLPEENNLYGLMAVGTSRDFPPGDPAGFDEFLRTAVTPVLHEMWQRAEPVTDIRTTRMSVNRLRRWNELARRPQGFIAVGDAVAVYNPVYGQGMTAAVLQAVALRDRLRQADDLDTAVERLHDDVMAVTSFAWQAATASDLVFPVTESRNMPAPTPEERAGAQYLGMVRATAVDDAYVAGEFYRALGLIRPEFLLADEVRTRVERWVADPPAPTDDLSRPPAWADADPPTRSRPPSGTAAVGHCRRRALRNDGRRIPGRKAPPATRRRLRVLLYRGHPEGGVLSIVGRRPTLRSASAATPRRTAAARRTAARPAPPRPAPLGPR
ncbi:FAD-dependent oxidoreductase [Frankia sp. B2]|nr:FAD-dependent oxidoreductase [Frankia sp. B2]